EERGEDQRGPPRVELGVVGGAGLLDVAQGGLRLLGGELGGGVLLSFHDGKPTSHFPCCQLTSFHYGNQSRALDRQATSIKNNEDNVNPVNNMVSVVDASHLTVLAWGPRHSSLTRTRVEGFSLHV